MPCTQNGLSLSTASAEVRKFVGAAADVRRGQIKNAIRMDPAVSRVRIFTLTNHDVPRVPAKSKFRLFKTSKVQIRTFQEMDEPSSLFVITRKRLIPDIRDKARQR